MDSHIQLNWIPLPDAIQENEVNASLIEDLYWIWSNKAHLIESKYHKDVLLTTT